ncbi:MAG: histidinol phosphate phosphatase domain-containing protein [bacterium]
MKNFAKYGNVIGLIEEGDYPKRRTLIMIDLHTHTFFSDGELLPAELIRRAEATGYKAIALTDHADVSNIEFIISRIVEVCAWCNKYNKIYALPGIELTHIPVNAIVSLASEARALGAKIIIVHGETLVEPVAPGTNRAAVEADIDILAHPGLVSDEVVKIAAKREIFLELSARRGHSLTNGHVASIARKYEAKMIVNTDGHAPSDLISDIMARQIILGAGLSENEADIIIQNSENIFQKKKGNENI